MCKNFTSSDGISFRLDKILASASSSSSTSVFISVGSTTISSSFLTGSSISSFTIREGSTLTVIFSSIEMKAIFSSASILASPCEFILLRADLQHLLVNGNSWKMDNMNINSSSSYKYYQVSWKPVCFLILWIIVQPCSMLIPAQPFTLHFYMVY